MFNIETVLFLIITLLNVVNTLIMRSSNKKLSSSVTKEEEKNSVDITEASKELVEESFDTSYYLAKFIECVKKENENGKNL